MFTGIIQHLGKIENIAQTNGITTLTVEIPAIASAKKKGQSVAVDGACLTVTHNTSNTLQFEVISETIQRTIIKNYKHGAKVNIEEPLKMSDSLDGHLVLGHVDFVGTIKDTRMDGDSKILAITFPLSFAQHFALKGSVTVNGVSLTISQLETDFFEVSLIPETQKQTNLGLLQKNNEVNIEIDMISRYLERLLQDKAQETTYQFLQERGFI